MNEKCPMCGNYDTWRNGCGNLQCENCGYDESQNYEPDLDAYEDW